MNELISLNFTLDPTFNIYEANRDVMRARTAEWHAQYTLPASGVFICPAASRTAPTGTAGAPTRK